MSHIILGITYEGYQKSLSALGLESLDDRRKQLCKTFALKSAKSDKFPSWFKENNKRKITRRTKSKYKKVETRTKRFETSSIPYMTKILNEEWKRLEDLPEGWNLKW